MGSLFSGTPQTAPSYVSSTTETPQWLQDAIYNQINWSQNIANMPYQPYSGQLVAGATPQESAAWQGVTGAQGAYKPYTNAALQGVQQLAGASGAEAAAAPYLQNALAANPFMAGQGALNAQAQMLGQMDYSAPSARLLPFVAQSVMMDGRNAAAPYLQAAAYGTAMNGMPVSETVGRYMNPYNEAVTNRIAELGARNLGENLAPALGSQFIRAGQFGSRGMGEMGARMVRDVNESVLGQQAQALQQGYGQALSTAQADAARQLQAAGQLASIGGQFGGLTQAQQQAILQAGQTLSAAEQQALAQSLAGAAQYGQMGQIAGGLAGQQQQAMLTAAQQSGALRSTDLQRQQSALAQLAQQAQQAQQMGYTDLAALEAAGQSQRQLSQAQLTSAYDQYMQGLMWPQQQLNFLSSQIRGLAPYSPTTQTQSGYTTTFGQSPLSQLATGLATGAGLYKLANLG